jgi:hypothetical protein
MENPIYQDDSFYTRRHDAVNIALTSRRIVVGIEEGTSLILAERWTKEDGYGVECTTGTLHLLI